MVQVVHDNNIVVQEPKQQQQRRHKKPLFRRLLSAIKFSMLLTTTLMVLFSLFGKRGAGASAMATSNAPASPLVASSRPSKMEVENRLRGALWGFLAGDALAAPTHWYYGGPRQVVADYGRPITDYTKPNKNLAGSILNKSDLNGGGRASWDSKHQSTSIIGDVINHGKKDLWSPNKSIHYHATLQKGENTLEVQIARVLMKSIVAQGGTFDADHFRQAYIDFMRTPNSHNDTYASTCHRMFFANLVYRKLPAEKCPDNDQHNVDTIDGLVLPTIAAMADPGAAASCASVTRRSRVLEDMSTLWGSVVQAALLQSDDASFTETLSHFAHRTIGRAPNPTVSDGQTMSACYLSQSLPGLVDMTAKYTTLPSNDKAWQGLLANANVGGENVHRGSVLGAILGARSGASQLSPKLVQGLYPQKDLAEEIDNFVAAIMPALEVHCRNEAAES